MNRERLGVLLVLKNPRARLSSTVTKGTVFSCLGELLWVLAGNNELRFIKYYLSRYDRFSDNGNDLDGAYGPRIFDNKYGLSQFESVVQKLKAKPSSRQAVIQIFDGQDILKASKDVPCTCTLQFFIRNNRLNMFTTMRSNDVFIGMPHDIFVFTMIQEILARRLGLELGDYRHAVGSLHLYEENLQGAEQYLKEGWQPSTTMMPSMPTCDPSDGIETLLKVESSIREARATDIDKMDMAEYWKDLARLLLIFRMQKEKASSSDIEKIKSEVSSNIYLNYIDRVQDKAQDRIADQTSLQRGLFEQ